MADYFVLPQTERTKSGFEAFSEAFTPGLEKAFQLALQRKMEEEQRKSEERQRQGVLRDLGIGKEQISPEGQAYAFKKMGITDPTNLEQVVGVQKRGISKFEIPEKFKSMILDREKLNQLPPGMKVPLGGGVEYAAPQSSLFQNVTIDEEGNPALKIGDKVIPLKSIGKSSATFKTAETDIDYSSNLSKAMQAIQSGKNPIAVFQRMAVAYPERSAELQRILLQKEKETLADIIKAVQGNR